MDFDVLAFIGRFQPFHKGHESVIKVALKRSKKVAIVIGSAEKPRSARNPFTVQDRVAMITSVFPDEVAQGRIHFVPQVDHTYNIDRWIAGIQTGVTAVAQRPFNPDPVRIGLIGHSKDHSSFYLKAFPTWDSVEVPNYSGVNATCVRKDLFETEDWSDVWAGSVSTPVLDFIKGFEQGEAFNTLLEEHVHLEAYKKQFVRPSDEEIGEWLRENTSLYPEHRDVFAKFADTFCPKYPPVFYTADAIVVQSGHILLIKRGAMPGKGLWALPGGFVNRYENSLDAALRELREETKIDVPEAVLRGSKTMFRLFEDPYRSERGRTLTNAYVFELRPEKKLPKIKGGDDAAKAMWVPLSNLTREAMFEDHYDIIETMVNI